MPTPPAAPWTRTRSPSVSPHWVNSASCAVVKTSGKPPASAQPRPAGTGSATRSCTTASSACAPPPTTAITWSPTREARRRRADRDDLACELEAGDVGGRVRRGGVQARALHHVGAVEPRGPHPDEELAVAGLGIGVVAPEHGAVDDRCRVHRATVRVFRRPRRSARSRTARCPAGPTITPHRAAVVPGPKPCVSITARVGILWRVQSTAVGEPGPARWHVGARVEHAEAARSHRASRARVSIVRAARAAVAASGGRAVVSARKAMPGTAQSAGASGTRADLAPDRPAVRAARSCSRTARTRRSGTPSGRGCGHGLRLPTRCRVARAHG